MKANELIQLINTGYADGNGDVVANWNEKQQEVVGRPTRDMLAFYLASAISDRTPTLGSKSDVAVLSDFRMELAAAIEDLNQLDEFLEKYLATDMAIRFFEDLERRQPQTIDERFIRAWLMAQRDCDSSGDVQIRRTICQWLGVAVGTEEWEMYDGSIGAQPTVDQIQTILARLTEARKAYWAPKTDKLGDTATAPVIPPEMK